MMIRRSFKLALWGLAFSLFTNFNTNAQVANSITPLIVGEKMPDLIFKELVNVDGASLRLSDLKGKLTILDIWNKSCAACIAGFPKMEKLQQQFSGELNVLLVTEDSRNEFEQLKRRSMIVQSTKLPYILEGHIVRQLFPSTFVPLHVWIDSSLTVVAITQGVNTNAAYISHFLRTGSLKTDIQNKSYTDFNSRESLLKEGNGRHLSSTASYSVFFEALKRVPKAGFGLLRDTASEATIGTRSLNTSLSFMISGSFYSDFRDRIIYEFTDHQGNTRTELNSSFAFLSQQKKYSYELKLPKARWGSQEALNEYMREDLKRFFQLNYKVEKRKIRKLTLVATNHPDRLKIKPLRAVASGGYVHVMEILGDTLYARNTTLAGLISRIENNFVFPRIQHDILVENGIDDNGLLDIKAVLKGNSVGEWNKELAKFGLKLEDSYITDDFLIVRGGPESYKIVFKEEP